MSDSDEYEGLIDLPMPKFRDEFRTYFDTCRKKDTAQNIFPISVNSKACKKFIKQIKVDNRTVSTLSFAEIHSWAKERHGKDVILYPSGEASVAAWKTVKVLRPDYTERQDKMCAMLWAAYSGDLKSLRKIISFGSYLDRQTENGNTVLMEALAGQSENRCKCIELLLKSGARVNLHNKEGHTLLTATAFLNDMAVLKLLHQRKNLKHCINHKTNLGSTALSIAVAKQHLELARFLVTECEADLLIEDRYQMTAACWAQVYCPPMAGYLCLKMGLMKEIEKFVLRRNELLRELSLRAKMNKTREGDRELFGVIYGLIMILLMLEPSRKIVVNKGMLNNISYHPLWDTVLEEEDDILDAQILQLLPWFVALGCSMLYNEYITLHSFIKGGAAKRLITGLNDMVLECEEEEESHVMVQALITPLIAADYGRRWLYKVAFEYTSIFKHFLDENDYLEENSPLVRKAFTMLMDANYRPYRMRENYKYFSEVAVKKLCPEPKMTVGEKLREAMAFFEEVKKEARAKKAAEFMENFLKMEEESRRRKGEQLLKAQMRKMKKREKKKLLKQQEKQEKQDSADVIASGEQAKKKKEVVHESPIKGKGAMKDLVKEDGERLQNDLDVLIAVREAEQMYGSQNDCSPKKTVKPKWQNSPKKTTDVRWSEGSAIESPWMAAKPRRNPNHKRTTSENACSPKRNQKKSFPPRHSLDQAGKPQQEMKDHYKEKSQHEPPKLMDITFPELPERSTQSTQIDFQKLGKISSPKQQPEMVESKTETPWKHAGENVKTDIREQMNEAQFPPLIPPNAITVTQLEQMQHAEEWPPRKPEENKISFFYQPDIEGKEVDKGPTNRSHNDMLNHSPQMIQTLIPKVPAASSNEGYCHHNNHTPDPPIVSNLSPANNSWPLNMNNQLAVLKPGAAGDQVANEKVEEQFTKINWIPRSKRWRVMFEHLVSLPAEKREKVGSIHFSFRDECLYIARGSNGTVVSIGLRDDGMEVAVKRLLKSNFRCLKNELENLRIPDVEHENIVKYRDYVEDENFGYLALELCECTLEDYVHELRHTKTLHKKSQRLVWQMLRGLEVLHRAKILHMDIKPRNVLIDVRGNVKLADFGISHRMDDDQSTVYQAGILGTRCWRPRETLIGQESGLRPPYKKSSDVQVAGMVAYYVMTGGLHPYGQDPSTVELAIARGIPKFRDVHDETLINLMAWMLHPEMEKRKSTAECLSHPFFWTDSKRFAFLYKVSQEPEIRDRTRQSAVQNVIDSAGLWLKLGDWRSEIDQFFLGPQMSLQNYTSQLSDLIRLMADVEDNFNTIAVHLRTLMGDPGNYFLVKFPKVFIVIYEIIRESDLRQRRSLADFFDINNYFQE